MSIIDTLITDRKLTDIDYINELKRLIQEGIATTAQINEWNSCSLKGSYNYTDLNRIGLALIYIQELAAQYQIIITYPTTPKTDWSISNVPSAMQLSQYLLLISYLRAAIPFSPSAPEAPTQIRSFQDANVIEEIIILAEDVIKLIYECFSYSGDCYSGA